jgi:hypothetical protein
MGCLLLSQRDLPNRFHRDIGRTVRDRCQGTYPGLPPLELLADLDAQHSAPFQIASGTAF